MSKRPLPTFPPIVGIGGALAVYNCSRTKFWKMRRYDPTFPRARLIAGKQSWLLSVLLEHRDSQELLE